jgi:hypothetical protein
MNSHHLDGGAASESLVDAFIDAGHSAPAYQGPDRVVAEARPNQWIVLLQVFAYHDWATSWGNPARRAALAELRLTAPCYILLIVDVADNSLEEGIIERDFGAGLFTGSTTGLQLVRIEQFIGL